MMDWRVTVVINGKRGTITALARNGFEAITSVAKAIGSKSPVYASARRQA